MQLLSPSGPSKVIHGSQRAVDSSSCDLVFNEKRSVYSLKGPRNQTEQMLVVGLGLRGGAG